MGGCTLRRPFQGQTLSCRPQSQRQNFSSTCLQLILDLQQATEDEELNSKGPGTWPRGSKNKTMDYIPALQFLHS